MKPGGPATTSSRGNATRRLGGAKTDRTRLGGHRWRLRHHERVLANGLEVLVVPTRASHRAVLTMLLRVGSRYENADNNGISHFLEHMLYRGSPSFKTAHEQALAFEEIGASLYLICADVKIFVKSMEERKVTCTPVVTERWGLRTSIHLPSGGRLGVYQPTHPTAI